jgi:hypothetical protein
MNNFTSQFSISLPFGIGSVTITPDEREKEAAWELYVELSTRIAVHPLKDNQGLSREALSSLYSMFATTREILRKAGHRVAKDKNSLGPLAIRVLNSGLRPFLAKWHPLLQEYEAQREAYISAFAHEQAWEYHAQLREELRQVQQGMQQYLYALAKIAGFEHVEDQKG